jgi:hypothetical protein
MSWFQKIFSSLSTEKKKNIFKKAYSIFFDAEKVKFAKKLLNENYQAESAICFPLEDGRILFYLVDENLNVKEKIFLEDLFEKFSNISNEEFEEAVNETKNEIEQKAGEKGISENTA